MNTLVYAVIFISCIIISYFDLKYKTIPVLTVLVNYVSICYLIGNPGLFLGIPIIFYAVGRDLPIDLLYVALIVYLIIIGSLSPTFIAIALLFSVLFVAFSKDKQISFMFPLEVILIAALI